MSGLFDLNERIFAAMDELDAADDDNLEQAIEKARVKTQLFAIAINNANTMARIAAMQEQSMDGLAMQVDVAGRLVGMPRFEARVEHALPEFDALAWVAEFAPGHTLSWTRDRLNKYANADYSFDEVQALLDEAHVERARLDGKSGGIQRAESDGYGLRGPQRGHVR